MYIDEGLSPDAARTVAESFLSQAHQFYWWAQDHYNNGEWHEARTASYIASNSLKFFEYYSAVVGELDDASDS